MLQGQGDLIVTGGKEKEWAAHLTGEGLGSKIQAVARADLRQAGSERFLAARRSRSAACPGLRRGEAV